jgi:hypothetical protein
MGKRERPRDQEGEIWREKRTQREGKRETDGEERENQQQEAKDI